ncbi:MAG: glutathione S-transferase N-terminal domain-containing protein [Deltaproteobacteria bacterium]|nr:glutathione S-transferase N-terminal domain-containing protein [Deltaproteobacteria bacterium]
MIDLYSFPTPNGLKASIMLEEVGLPYKVHVIHIGKGDQHKPDFVAINPNGKIPAIVDSEGPDGQPITVFESGAILIYLAEKTGKLLSSDARKRYETLQWLMFQMGGLGPMLGQLNHFVKYAPEKVPYAIERYSNEGNRLMDVLNRQLANRDYLVGDYSIADVASYAWVKARQAMGSFDDFPHVSAWLDRVGARPAVQRGVQIPRLP